MFRKKPSGTDGPKLLPLEVALLDVTVQLLGEGREEVYGYSLSAELKVRHGVPVVGYSTLYRGLGRLVEFGLLEERWEVAGQRTGGRPARRFYRLTAAGQTAAAHLVAPMVTVLSLGAQS